MNDNNASEDHERNTRQYLQNAAGSYVMDASSGLYKPCSDAKGDKVNTCTCRQIKDHGSLKARGPQWTEIADTLVAAVALLISFATLVGLFITAKYAYLQWGEAKRTADASIVASAAAQDSANTTRGALTASIEQFELANRAYLSTGDPLSERPEKWRNVIVPIVNQGHVPSVIHSVSLRYDRLPERVSNETTTTFTAIESRAISVKGGQVVAPGSAGFKLSLESPSYSADIAESLTLAHEHLLVEGNINYGTGFGKIDSFRLCLYYQNPKSGWHSCSGNGISVKASNGKKTDPQTYQISK